MTLVEHFRANKVIEFDHNTEIICKMHIFSYCEGDVS